MRLGQLLMTPGAIAAFQDVPEGPGPYISRHAKGDWGNVCDTDARLNDRALERDERVLSEYRLSDDTRIWII
jgi:hypothetical protein